MSLHLWYLLVLHLFRLSDLHNCDTPAVLQYRHRIIFLSKPVDEELGNQLVATMLYLDSENQKDLNLYINCSGGNVGGHFLL